MASLSHTLTHKTIAAQRRTRIADMLSTSGLHSEGLADQKEDQNIFGEKGNTEDPKGTNDELSDAYSLKYFHASLFATVLEDAITQLRLLSQCNSRFRLLKTRSDLPLLRARKFGVTQPAVTDELSCVDHCQLEKEEYKLDKLANDRKYVGNCLTFTYLDLSVNRSYQALVEQISDILERDSYRAALAHEEANNKVLRHELQKQLRIQRNHVKSDNYDMDIVIERLKKQVEDSTLLTEVSSRYVTHWEQSRSEQHDQRIRAREVPAIVTVRALKHKLQGEQRVHSEVTMLVHVTINETLDKVETIMNKYDKDMDALDLKIQIMNGKYEDAVKARLELEAQYTKREQEAKAWVEYKQRREEERVYRQTMHQAAIVAQAWWRGIMVRLQLGPYKPRRKTRSVKDDGKKKKKKKK